MIHRLIPIAGSSVLLCVTSAAAQDLDEMRAAAAEQGKWAVTMSVVASNAAIKIVDSEIELPSELEETDFEATLGEDLSVSSTIVSGSVGYRVLPFLEVVARAGLISSDTETGVIITGTPNGPFSDLFDGPITIDRDANRDVDGYSLGVGANAALPIMQIGPDTLAAYSGFQFVRNEFDESVSSEGATANFGLIYPVNLDRKNVVYRIGGSYNWISRDVEQALSLNGETVRVNVTQEFEDPWAVDAGIGIPLTDNTQLGLGVWHQLSGETSALASLTYRFD
ncbi:MAG: hypothetical protein AAFO74_05615 [Pseudomonadota bacterium]